ncbi:alkaline phytoceramidase [Mollisia scopiformis]|uniref:Alkaline phytoceramidase n=1 Tax=Mollisia scopiformis TaxID=149040 RepID=A0A194X4U0_MOLSC|nr:alkaline phytoceramidase [Mollisia scopiformis]KUJ15190.1 alkaline phytoceramidase [Mollisia scopiformis]
MISLSFCEEDYAVTQYIAEFINTLSNIAYIYCALYYPSGTKSRRKLDSMSMALIMVGITSTLYHATLRHSMMLGDDFSMWLIVACILRPLYCRGQSPAVASFITAVIALACCVMTIIYLHSGSILIHTGFFAFLLQLIWPRTLFLIYGAGNRSQMEKKKLLRRFLKAAVTLIVAFAAWDIDLERCPQLREIRKSIGLPCAWALELHGWWHVLTAVGAAEYITLVRILCDQSFR